MKILENPESSVFSQVSQGPPLNAQNQVANPGPWEVVGGETDMRSPKWQLNCGGTVKTDVKDIQSVCRHKKARHVRNHVVVVCV